MGTYDLFRKIAQSSLTEKEREVAQMKNDLSYDFESTPSYYSVTINGVEQDVHIISDKKTEQKKILSKPDESFDAGDVVVWNSVNWLVWKVDVDDQIQTKGMLLECNNTLNLYVDHVLYQIPACIESNVRLYSLGYDENKYLSIPDSNIVVRIPNTINTQNIKRDDIYNLSGDNYKVVDFNKVIEPGIIVLKMEYCAESAESHTYVLSILNGSSIQIAQSQSLTINTQLTDNGVVVSNPSLTYSSSDITKATISSSGIVTVLDVGMVTFTVRITNDNTINDSIVVEIVEEVEDNFTVDVYGDSTVVLSDIITINAKVYNNGSETSNGVVWSLSNNDLSSNMYLSVISSTIHSITLQASSDINYKNKYVTVRGTLIDGVGYDEIQVKLISLF